MAAARVEPLPRRFHIASRTIFVSLSRYYFELRGTMRTRLIYHRPEDEFSPFDEISISIAKDSELRVACPYFTLEYLNRLVRRCNSWRVITDVEEWLATLKRAERKRTVRFIKLNLNKIRHSPELHAKVLIGSSGALVGSANLTTSGIQRRTEMGVFLTDSKLRKQIGQWYEVLWSAATLILPRDLDVLSEQLPIVQPSSGKVTLIGDKNRRFAPLEVSADENQASKNVSAVLSNEDRSKARVYRSVWRYKRARAYERNGRFYVLEGSLAKGEPTKTFKNFANGRYLRIRDALIEREVLVREPNGDAYRFTADVPFSSRSEAAYIIAGNPRSGAEWKSYFEGE